MLQRVLDRTKIHQQCQQDPVWGIEQAFGLAPTATDTEVHAVFSACAALTGVSPASVPAHVAEFLRTKSAPDFVLQCCSAKIVGLVD